MSVITPKQYKANLLEAGILSSEGVHYELASGLHGRKLEFDKVIDGSELFDQTVQITAERIRRLYNPNRYGRLALIGVANGANRFIDPIAEELGLPGYKTQKDENLSLLLTAEAQDFVDSDGYDSIVVFDDVGTQGTNSSMVAKEIWRVRPKAKVFVLNEAQRSPTLPLLTAIGVPYDHVLYWPLPSFSPQDCHANPEGYCRRGWEIVDRFS